MTDARAIIDAALVAVTRTPHGEHVLIDTRDEDERESVTNAILAALAEAGLEIVHVRLELVAEDE